MQGGPSQDVAGRGQRGCGGSWSGGPGDPSRSPPQPVVLRPQGASCGRKRSSRLARLRGHRLSTVCWQGRSVMPRAGTTAALLGLSHLRHGLAVWPWWPRSAWSLPPAAARCPQPSRTGPRPVTPLATVRLKPSRGCPSGFVHSTAKTEYDTSDSTTGSSSNELQGERLTRTRPLTGVRPHQHVCRAS